MRVNLASLVATDNYSSISEYLKKNPAEINAEYGGKTALYWAAEWGRLELVELLVMFGATYAVSWDGNTPVLAAVKQGCLYSQQKNNTKAQKYLKVVSCLLGMADAKEKIDTQYSNETALYWAAKYGQLELVRLLVAAGAIPTKIIVTVTRLWANATLKQDDSPLLVAISRGHLAVVNYFLNETSDDFKGKAITQLNVHCYRTLALTSAAKSSDPQFTRFLVSALIKGGGDKKMLSSLNERTKNLPGYSHILGEALLAGLDVVPEAVSRKTAVKKYFLRIIEADKSVTSVSHSNAAKHAAAQDRLSKLQQAAERVYCIHGLGGVDQESSANSSEMSSLLVTWMNTKTGTLRLLFSFPTTARDILTAINPKHPFLHSSTKAPANRMVAEEGREMGPLKSGT